MDSLSPSSRCYTWTISNFSGLTHGKCYSDVFTIGGCKWRILIYPRGDQLGINLDVPDAASLSAGWSREAYFTLSVVNHDDGNFSMRKDTIHVFKAEEADWGFESFMAMSCLWDLQRGFLIDDTVIVKAEIYVLSVVPPIVIPEAAPRGPLGTALPAVHAPRVMETNRPPHMEGPVINALPAMGANRFDSFFTRLKEFIITRETKEGSSSETGSSNRNCDLIPGTPSLREVEEAKQSLKECLSDLFKLNMKDRLETALSTLARAEVGLSCDQQRSIREFWDNFDDFISDFLMFEQDNSEFELQKLARDNIFSTMKKNHETHLSNKQLLDALNKEEEDLNRRLEEVDSRKEKLISEWECLMVQSEEMKSKLTAQEKKLAEAEEKKWIAEERMSRSAAAWSSLKAQFTEVKLHPATPEHRHQMTRVQMNQKGSVETEGGTRYLNIFSFLGNLLNRQIVGFRSLAERPGDSGFSFLDLEGSSVELRDSASSEQTGNTP